MAIVLTLTALSLFVSTLVALYFYRKSKKEKEPVCLFENTTLEPRKLPLSEYVKILYGDKELERITRTRLILWNKGRDPIVASDIKTFLEIEIPSGEIFDAYVVKVTRDSTGFRVTPIRQGPTLTNRVSINFDLLDQGDGALIEILSTGDYGSKPYFVGTIVGAPKGVRTQNLNVTPKWISVVRNLILIMAFISVVSLGTISTAIKDLGWPKWIIVPPTVIVLLVFIFDRIIDKRLWPQYPKELHW